MITTTAQNVTIMYGNHSSLRVGMKAKELGMSKVMVVTDKGVFNAGLVEPILRNLQELDIETVLYDGVLPDPPDTMVNEAAAIARENKVDGLIGLGGGSSIDTTKAVNVLINNDPPISNWYVPAVPTGAAVPMIVLPTTAGTGSECTSGGVITDTATNQKKAVGSAAHGYAALVIVDPTLYVGMPVLPSVYTAFDIITHSVDAICNPTPEPFAETYAEKALRLTMRNLKKIIANPKDLEARGALAIAATMGGAAINGNMCHLTHAIGHTLGTFFHQPHGMCCALCLPKLLEYYALWVPNKVRIVAECMGLDLPEDLSPEELGKQVSAAMLAFMKETGIKSMKELEMPLEKVLETIPVMGQDFTKGFSPRLPGPSMFKEIIEASYDQ